MVDEEARLGQDEKFRRLEREAVAGDAESRNRLVEERARVNGQPILLERYQTGAEACRDALSRLEATLVGQCARPTKNGTTCREALAKTRNFQDYRICESCEALLHVARALAVLEEHVANVTDAARWNGQSVESELEHSWQLGVPWWTGSFAPRNGA